MRSTNPVDLAADLFVFAPIGFVMEAGKVVPTLVERGRKEVSNARIIGSFVTPILRKKAQIVLRERLAGTPRPPGRKDPTPTTTPTPTPVPPVEADGNVQPSYSDGSLPIDGYDQLPSSAIVELLDRLTPEECSVVAAYEAQNRKRRTILTRARQRAAKTRS